MTSEPPQAGATPGVASPNDAGAASFDDDANMTPEIQGRTPMRHNDLELQSLLRLARCCLKYERLPGELGEREFFDKFDSELEAERSKQLSEESIAKESSCLNDPGPSRVLSMEEAIGATLDHIKALQKLTSGNLQSSTTFDRCFSQIDEARKETGQSLKSETSQLERIAKEAREALSAADGELSTLFLKKMQLEKEETAAEVELQKAHHQVKLAKDMVKRQHGEIKSLHSDIQRIQAAAAAQAAQTVAPTPQPPTGSRKTKAVRPSPGGRTLSQSGVGDADASSTDNAVAGGPSVTEYSSSLGSRVQPPKPPNLAHHIVAPQKTRAELYCSVLSSRPSADTWKKFIP